MQFTAISHSCRRKLGYNLIIMTKNMGLLLRRLSSGLAVGQVFEDSKLLNMRIVESEGALARDAIKSVPVLIWCP